uniref:UBC n=1 Tax=Arundo donax TaxID=35708 RepID=A0A0A9D994_ARUDO
MGEHNIPEIVSWDNTTIVCIYAIVRYGASHPMAYFCVQLRAVASYLGRSVLYM